jgi:hypothetical protein
LYPSTTGTIEHCMTENKKPPSNGTKAAIAAGAAAGAAIGSAAVAAALMFASNRRNKAKNEPAQLPPIPSGEPPETD